MRVCDWCEEKFAPKPNAPKQRFCAKKCKDAHYRNAKLMEQLELESGIR